MIVAGGLLAAWGALVLWFARPVHAGWRDVLRSARPAGAPGAAPVERGDPERAARWIRRAALAGLLAGLALSAIGAIRIAVESM